MVHDIAQPLQNIGAGALAGTAVYSATALARGMQRGKTVARELRNPQVRALAATTGALVIAGTQAANINHDGNLETLLTAAGVTTAGAAAGAIIRSTQKAITTERNLTDSIRNYGQEGAIRGVIAAGALYTGLEFLHWYVPQLFR